MECTFSHPRTTAPQTFGLELELLCIRPNDSLPDEYADILDAIYAAFLHYDIPVSDHNSLSINDGAAPFSQWRIEEEVLSLSPEEALLLPRGYIVEGIELASRKFFHAHEDWRTELATVLHALREVEAQLGVKFLVNESTGLHVHVGYDGEAVPLRTAKNVFLLNTAFERVLDSLHAAPRIAIPSDKEERHHCYPLSFFATKRSHGVGLFERLQYIERIASYEQLGSCFFISADEMGMDEGCTGHNSALNFDNLFPDPENGRHAETLTGTVEFRQHTGTLDWNAIVAWIELTIAIVRFAEMESPGPILDLLAMAVHPGANVAWLCDTLGVPQEVEEYYTAVAAGKLVQPGPEVSGAHSLILPLLSQNWSANAASSSRAAVQLVINEKTAQGMYGHDPVFAPLELPPTVGQGLLGAEIELNLALGVESWGDESLSCAMVSVLGKLARAHERVMRGKYNR